MSTLNLGPKVRALRRRNGITQRQLARDLGISPSYLNLIEHDRRPLTTALLIALAQRFDLDVASFAEDRGEQLRRDLLEAFAQPAFDEFALSNRDIEAFVQAHPQIARAVRALWDRQREASERAQQLAGPEPVSRLPSEEVSDFIQERGNHFADLEAAAEELWRRARLTQSTLVEGLRNHLQGELLIDLRIAQGAELPGVLRRYDPQRRELVLSEQLPPRSATFQLAHQVALLAYADRIEGAVRSATLTSESSRALARVALANYFAGAVMMPYRDFLDAAQRLRYDLELLGHRFRTSLEQVCHRLTSLRRRGEEGIPLHMVRVDVAGNISKKFSATGIRFARFGSACALWNVFQAFLTPGRFRTQLSTMPDGNSYFCVARTVPKGRGGFHAPSSLMAVGLGARVQDARNLVYADGVDLSDVTAAVPIGVSCRLCERANCPQRAFPQIHRELDLDPNVRRLTTYGSEQRPGRSGGQPTDSSRRW
jgi:predicted transcriptional regulator/transcriptional regulator with XRE-family HTH domain